jgi:phage repressor protein C with HTH and peptisase S24 domain
LQIRSAPNEPIQAFIKTLRRRNDAIITVEQLNPPTTIEFARGTVVAMHKVLTLNDLFEV